MAITRRQFLQYAAASAAALGLSELELFQLTEKVMAISTLKPRVVALQGQACSGDITALANLMNSIPPTALGADFAHFVADEFDGVEGVLGVDGTLTSSYPTSTVDDVLIDVIDLTFQPTVCGPAGSLAWTEGVVNVAGGSTPYLVLVEGSVPMDGERNGAAVIGEDACRVGAEDGDPEGTSMAAALEMLADTANCLGVVAWGTCAAYGGIPAANNANDWTKQGTSSVEKFASTGALSVSDAINKMALASPPPVVNVPGCPTRPDDLFLVVAGAILDVLAATYPAGLVAASTIERASNPTTIKPKAILGINLFGQTQHFNCHRKQAWADGNFASSFADTDGKCLAALGCEGMGTYASCQNNKKHQWNATVCDGANKAIHDTAPDTPWPSAAGPSGLGVVTNNGGSSCIKKGHPCIGCKEKGFPDRFSPLVDYLN